MSHSLKRKILLQIKLLSILLIFITIIGCAGSSSGSDAPAPQPPASPTTTAPDLVVSVTASKTTIDSGETFNLSAIVTNNGNGTANSTTLRFLISTDNIISTSDTFLNVTRNISNLSAGGSNNVSVSVTGHSSGTMYYGACVVPVSGESNPNNNCSVPRAIIATPPTPAPDLVVSSFTATPTTISSGGTVFLSAIVTNNGNGTANSTTLRFLISTDNIISTSDTFLNVTRNISNLSAGGSNNVSVSVTGHSSGTMYYGACVVPVSGESNPNNNCSVPRAIIATPPTPAPDLVVSSFTATPTPISSGGVVNLSAIVTNSGDGTADSTILRYYRSTSNSISDSGTPLATDNILNLSANSSSSESAEVTGHSSGTMYYGVCVYVAGETSTDNNCSITRAVTVGVPDLGVSVTATPTIISSGGTINLSAIVTNNGNGTADTTTLRFLRSTDSTISTSDTFLNVTRNISNLSAGSSSDTTAEVIGHSSGIYYYWACVVAVSGETTTDDNCSVPQAITALQPDLSVDFTVSKTRIDSGETFNLSAIVTNSGNGTANSTTLRFLRSPNNNINDFVNNLVTTDSISSLSANSSSDSTAEVDGHGSGIYYYWACVVAVSGESSITNNCSDSTAVTAIVGASWQQSTALADWTARCCHSSVVFDNRIWVLGGNYNDVWSSSNGSDWEQATDDAGWAARQYHTSIAFDNKMWVLGGNDGSRKNDVLFSINGSDWEQATASADWTARYGHTSVVFDNKIWVLGGSDGSNKNDVWSSINGSDWEQATDSAGWTGRWFHTSVAFDNKIWVLGGSPNGIHRLNDVWSSLDGTSWTEVTASAGFTRYLHTSVAFDNKIWVLGGYDGSRENDVWFSENGTNWSQATAFAGWSRRYNHTSVAFDNKIWVIGGSIIGNVHKNDVWFSGINNNSFANATSLDSGSKSLNSHSAILTAGASDFYRISLTAGDWTFSTQSSIDTFCELYNSSNLQTPLAQNDDSSVTDANCSITDNITADREGDYYILVKGRTDSVKGNYTLNIDSTTD